MTMWLVSIGAFCTGASVGAVIMAVVGAVHSQREDEQLDHDDDLPEVWLP